MLKNPKTKRIEYNQEEFVIYRNEKIVIDGNAVGRQYIMDLQFMI